MPSDGVLSRISPTARGLSLSDEIFQRAVWKMDGISGGVSRGVLKGGVSAVCIQLSGADGDRRY